MSLMREFRDFIGRRARMGTAFNKIVDSIVKGVTMPVATIFVPGTEAWERWSIGRIRIGTVLDATFQLIVSRS